MNKVWKLVIILSFAGLQACSSGEEGTSGGGSSSPPTSPQSPPNAPVISSSQNLLTNTTSTSVTGTCEVGATVLIEGAAVSSMPCSASGDFSYNASQALEGSYTYLFAQSNGSGTSGYVSVSWQVDLTPPEPPAITIPSSNPFSSGDAQVTISGTCENDATVYLAQTSPTTSSQNVVCSSNSYSFTFTPDSPPPIETYSFNLYQTDVAGNTSDNTAFSWTRDAGIPATPVITSPAVANYFSNGNQLTITGTCDTDNIVTIGGDIIASEVGTPANSLDATCVASAFTFIINKSTDATYSLTFVQENTTTLVSSAAANLSWTRDTVAPNAPTITSPLTSPFTAPGNLTIAGSCEAQATVKVYEAAVEIASGSCSSGTYSITVNKSVDAQYTLEVGQTDRALNASASTTQQIWDRDSSAIPTPVISTPASASVTNNLSAFTISGSCNTGYTVSLSGDVIASEVSVPSNSLTQVCQAGSFSYVINKSNDGTFGFLIDQSYSGTSSTPASVTWTRDTAAPSITINSGPLATNNPTASAVFTFSSNDASASFTCSLNGGAFSSCTSPKTYTFTTADNTSHSFAVRATDAAGNSTTSSAYNWSQLHYKTIAMYHLDDANGTDSSNYNSTSYNNTLTNSGTTSTTGPSSVTGSSNARNFNNDSMYVASNAALNATITTMTVEFFFQVNASGDLPGNNQYKTFISKSGTTAANSSWEVRLRKKSNKLYIEFAGKNSAASTVSEVISNQITINTGTWYHAAVVWDKGNVRFYYNGQYMGAKTIGTAGSTILTASSANLRLGANNSPGQYFLGDMDLVRISQVVRYTSTTTYTVPNNVTAFAAD